MDARAVSQGIERDRVGAPILIGAFLRDSDAPEAERNRALADVGRAVPSLLGAG